MLNKIPGFRTNTTWKKIVSIIGHSLIFFTILSLIGEGMELCITGKDYMLKIIENIVMLFFVIGVPYITLLDIFYVQKKIKKFNTNNIFLIAIFRYMYYTVAFIIIGIFILPIASIIDSSYSNQYKEAIGKNVKVEQIVKEDINNEIKFEEEHEIKDEIVQEVKAEEEQKVEEVLNNTLITNPLYIKKYMDINKIEIQIFKEKKKIESFLNNIEAKQAENKYVFIEEEYNLMRGSSYKETLENTNLIYLGDLKDNRPDGIGMLIEDIGVGVPMIKYVGNFQKGRFEGFGMEMYIPSEDEVMKAADLAIQKGSLEERQVNTYFNYLYDLKMKGINQIIEKHIDSNPLNKRYQAIENEELEQEIVTKELIDKIQFEVLDRANYIEYEGIFKDGKQTGKGNKFEFLGVEEEYKLMLLYNEGMISQESMGNEIKHITIKTGEFKEGLLEGQGKIYKKGKLLYTGKLYQDVYTDQGELYFEGSDQLQYQGEFSMGLPHGKGVLYDESGKIVHKGTFSRGDIK